MHTHVLVVEDDSELRGLLVQILTQEGYAVTAAADGAEALERLRDDPPCVMILDLMMPGVTGWQVLQHVSANAEIAERVAVIVLSAAGRSALAHIRLPSRGEVLAKPVPLERLLETVRRCVS